MKPVRVQLIILSCIVGFINNLVERIIITIGCVTNKTISLDKGQGHSSYLSFIGYYESLLYPAYNCLA